jgi:pyruvate formate lyase activating enzyme
MRIGGLRKLSLIDYPGEISSVIFTTGCNFRCLFCHNSHLVLPELYQPDLCEDDIIKFLKSRIGKISAVVISGGEPALHKDLPRFISVIKNLGFKIKLDTNGAKPDVLQNLISEGLLDFIAMDIKSSPQSYSKITGVETDMNKIIESISIIRNSALRYQFRMTLLKGFHTDEEIKKAEELIPGETLVKQYFKYEESVLDKRLTKDNEF